MTTSAEIRDRLVDALRLDLVGPTVGGAHEREVLPIPPTGWYLTGFLAPSRAGAQQRASEAAGDELANGADRGGGDDDAAPEPAAARRVFVPSSMGLSLLVPASAKSLRVTVRWGEYRVEEVARAEAAGAGGGAAAQTGDATADAGPGSGGVAGEGRMERRWRRTPRELSIEAPLPATGVRRTRRALPGTGSPAGAGAATGGALELVIAAREARLPDGPDGTATLPAGTRAVSVFLVNTRDPAPDDRKDEGFVFQVELAVRLEQGFVPRPNVRGLESKDRDERIADLQCRDAVEFAVGHNAATTATVTLEAGEPVCREVRTTWVPSAEVEKVVPETVPGVELGMEALAAIASVEEARARLGALADRYGEWIEAQRARSPASGPRREVALDLLQRAGVVRERIRRGIASLADKDALQAFQIANRTMAQAARQRASHEPGAGPPAGFKPPSWRPFQLAFLLVNMPGMIDPGDPDRETVDLLFFPTGGGKTEAYLGLAAFTLVLRRLRAKGVAGAGVSVLMRYTLRLLTLDQLSRAATLICALELERERDVTRLGTWPFEIGLWVGQAATPNRMGRKGDDDKRSARARTIAFQNDDRKPSPIPLESCPWCGHKFRPQSFRLLPGPDEPTDLRIVCASRTCPFQRERSLPIVAVDEPIYRRLPCFVIATVDKLAALPWVGRTGALFGKVDRADASGFYGPCDPGRGRPLDAPLAPPDLVIQDELHLISGPLGTMVGLYETAIDALSTLVRDGRAVRPKIVASTATVRRAETQIRALFGRSAVEIFPPPGPDRRDSFFAKTVPVSDTRGRRYVGIAAQGRSGKVLLLRSYLALLGAAARERDAARGPRGSTGLNPADPYLTLVGYFGSLRELGGSRRIVEDEVTARVAGYSRRRRVGEAAGAFADRRIRPPLELTSRETTDKVADAKRRLAQTFAEDEPVDVALATNMISVGLDITRLGLMVVLGQPKTTAEYIQATSRVGRDDARPGLVVTLFNVHRPRDRSHYERFEAFHATFYRAVEATSVTPFSPRALDRGLAGVTVALARHGDAALTAPLRAIEASAERSRLDFVVDALGRRAEAHNGNLSAADAEDLRKRVRGRVGDLLDDWAKVAEEKRAVAAGLQYNVHEEAGAPPLLFDPLDPALETASKAARRFKAHRSLRDVEASVNLWVKRLDGSTVPEEDDA